MRRIGKGGPTYNCVGSIIPVGQASLFGTAQEQKATQGLATQFILTTRLQRKLLTSGLRDIRSPLLPVCETFPSQSPRNRFWERESGRDHTHFVAIHFPQTCAAMRNSSNPPETLGTVVLSSQNKAVLHGGLCRQESTASRATPFRADLT